MATDTTTTETPDTQAEDLEAQSSFLSRLEDERSSVFSKIDELENQKIIGRELDREAKNTNKDLENKIKKQKDWLKTLDERIDKANSWEERKTSAGYGVDPDDPDAPPEGPGESTDPASSVNYDRPDVTRERLEDTYGVTGTGDPEVQALERRVNIASNKAAADIEKLRQFSDQLMSGAIPADVSEAVQRASSAGSFARGISSGQMARNLSARDLGMTSYDIMQQGAQLAGAAAQAGQSQAAFEAGRSQYRQQFQLATAEFQDALRRTDLSVDQMREEKRQFKAKMVLALNEQILNLAQFREELQFKYASTKLQGKAKSAEGPLETIDALFPKVKDSLRVDDL